MIKSFKLFESSKYWQERVDRIMNQIHSAQIVVDGDLGKRIEKYDSYQLVEVDIDKLNIDEYYRFDDLVDEYIERYNKTKKYPPVVITSGYKLIDGNHRTNALNKLGFNKIKAFKGIK